MIPCSFKKIEGLLNLQSLNSLPGSHRIHTENSPTNRLEQKIENYSRHFLLMAAFANDDTFKEKNCVSLPEKCTADPSSPLTTLVRLLFSRHCSESSSWENLSCLHFACGAALHAGKPFWLPHRVGLNDWRRIWAEFCFDLSRWKFPAT